MPLPQPRISHLIYGGVFVLVAAVVLLAHGRFNILESLEDDFSRLQQVARTSRVAAHVVDRVAALSAAIREYVAGDAIAPSERIAARSRELVAAIADARPALPAERAEIARLAGEAERYMSSFEAVVAARRQREERLGRLAQAAGALRAASDGAGAQSAFMQLRDAELGYLATRNAADIDRVLRNVASLERVLGARAGETVAEYGLAFGRVVEIFRVIDSGTARILDLHDANLRAMATGLVARAQAGEVAAATGFRETLDRGMRRNVEVFLVAVFVALAGAFLLVRFVIRPLTRMTSTMTAIAHGDYAQAVPFAARRDEIGQMASALSTFRNALLELKAAQSQAEAASRHKSDFVANVSHELRTPLNAIIGLTDMLLEDVENPDPRELKESLPRIRAAAKHLLGLINELLDLSAIEAGRMTLQPAEFSPAVLAEESAATLSAIARSKGLALDVGYPEELPVLVSDPQRVRQILINLIGNAVKFTDRGGVRLEVSADDARVRFAVTDTGPGIAPEDVGRLFQEFTQLDASPTRKFGGSGLGLALSRRMARLLGGDVTLASQVGRGSTFVLELPRGTPSGVSGRSGDAGGFTHAPTRAVAQKNAA